MPAGSTRTIVTRAFYLVGLALLLTPFLSLIVAWPFRVGAPDWRFQQFNTLVGGLTPAALGLAIMLLTARALEHRRAQLLVSWLAMAGALGVMILLGNYLLDALELRALVVPEQRGALLRLAIKGTIQSLVEVTVLAGLGYAGLRAAWRRPASEPVSAASLVRRPTQTLVGS